MDRAMRVVESAVDFLSGHVQGWILFMMMLLVLTDVVTRYVLSNPLSIAEEYGAYMLVAITSMGLAFTWKEGSHVRIDLFITRLPAPLRAWLRIATLLMAFLFTLFLVLASYQLVSFSLMFGTRSGSWVRTPIAWPQIPLIVGSGLLFLQLLVELIKAIRALHAGKGEKA
jgi:TRAP-type C4-dicarboxylate transport system permease small subunit